MYVAEHVGLQEAVEGEGSGGTRGWSGALRDRWCVPVRSSRSRAQRGDRAASRGRKSTSPWSLGRTGTGC